MVRKEQVVEEVGGTVKGAMDGGGKQAGGQQGGEEERSELEGVDGSAVLRLVHLKEYIAAARSGEGSLCYDFLSPSLFIDAPLRELLPKLRSQTAVVSWRWPFRKPGDLLGPLLLLRSPLGSPLRSAPFSLLFPTYCSPPLPSAPPPLPPAPPLPSPPSSLSHTISSIRHGGRVEERLQCGG